MSHRVVAGVFPLALFVGGCSLDPDPRISYPEGDALAVVALRVGPIADELDALALWTVLHPDIRARTSRAAYVECAFSGPDRQRPTDPPPESDELARDLWNVSFRRGDVRSDNVLVKDGNTYSIAARHDDGRIGAFDVRVDGPDGASTTTVLLTDGAADGDGPTSYVVGAVPEDRCLVGADAVVEHVQATATITVGHYHSKLPELDGYQVVALVRDRDTDARGVVGGTFWWTDDGGNGAGVVHPLTDGDAGADEDLRPGDPGVRAEPPQPGEWVSRDFRTIRAAPIEPGAYVIDVWANPIELAPSTQPGVPAGDAERRCAIDLAVDAGTHVDVVIDDIPDGGECPHEIKLRSPLSAPEP